MRDGVLDKHLTNLAEFIYNQNYEEQAIFFKSYLEQHNFSCSLSKGVVEFNFPDIGWQLTIKMNSIKKEEKKPETYIDRIRDKHPNAYAKWTSEDDNELLMLHNAGRTVKELSKIFGRQRGGITSRLSKLGIELTDKELNFKDKG